MTARKTRRRLSPLMLGVLLTPAVAACRPFGPNASGQWSGLLSCQGQPPLDVWLDLVESSGSTGELTGSGRTDLDKDTEDTGARASGVIKGKRSQRELSLQWWLRTEPWHFNAQLRGDQLVGEMDSPWDAEATTCTMRLDR